MKSLFATWALTALALLIGAALIPGVEIESAFATLLAAAILGLLNAFVKPVLFILTLPITILTLGLFALILNVLMISLAAWISPGFMVAGFWSAVLLAIVIAVVNALVGRALNG